MNTNRIASLIRYDWMLHKHNIKLTYAVIAIIYICIALLFFISKFMLNFDEDPAGMPKIIAGFCLTFFNYASIAMVLMMTTLVTEKFCNPRTATAYLTLPGTSVEKYCVVLFDYLATYIGIKVLYLIMFYITMGLCYLNAPELNWAQNGFALLLPNGAQNSVMEMLTEITGENAYEQLNEVAQSEPAMVPFVDRIMSFANLSIWLAPISAIAGFAYYLVLTMLFKTNAQIKAIGCGVLTYIVWIVFNILLVFGFLGSLIFKAQNLIGVEADQFVAENIMTPLCSYIYMMEGFLYISPLLAIGLLYLFYRQICHKQAK